MNSSCACYLFLNTKINLYAQWRNITGLQRAGVGILTLWIHYESSVPQCMQNGMEKFDTTFCSVTFPEAYLHCITIESQVSESVGIYF